MTYEFVWNKGRTVITYFFLPDEEAAVACGMDPEAAYCEHYYELLKENVEIQAP